MDTTSGPSMDQPEGAHQIEVGVPQPPPSTGVDEITGKNLEQTVEHGQGTLKKPKETFVQAASSKALRPFVIISSSYLLFTITDGAIRMIVLLHAYNKSFSALEVALMFTLYELAGVFTNLVCEIVLRALRLSFVFVTLLTLTMSTIATGCRVYGCKMGYQVYANFRTNPPAGIVWFPLRVAR